MNRIDSIFEKLNKENKKALIPFISCGTPNLEETIDNVFKLEESGADIIEIGVPFSDPLADGEVIQNAYVKALRNGTKVKDVFTLGKEVRKKSEVGLIIMVYYNLVYSRGVDKFIKEASEAGYDGLIVPDIPLEERKELQDKCEKEGIYLIPLVAPTSKERISKIVENTKGFVYCVSSTGTTGERSSFRADLKEYLDLVKEKSGIPICLGFGISSKEVVAKVKEHCDGVIVGSAVVRRLEEDREKAFEFVKELSSECKDGVLV